MKIDLDILEEQHLVGKFKLLEIFDKISPYRNSKLNVERRLSYSIKQIPEKYQLAALCLFGTTLYITEQMLYSSWNYLWHQVKKIYDINIEETLILELDRDQLRDEFYRSNMLVGRLQDNIPIRSVHDIIDILIRYEKGKMPKAIKDMFIKTLNKKFWILLIDLCISGSSAISEIQRLKELGKLIKCNPQIITLIQLSTEQSLEKLKILNTPFYYAINIPYSCALNHDSYDLITDKNIVRQMHETCQWFGEKYVLESNYRIANMSKEANDKNIAYYGFGKLGWNIVTYKNTPNNSLPLLWFTSPKGSYLSPFERIDSRIKESWAGRRDFITRISKDEKLKEKISNLITSHK